MEISAQPFNFLYMGLSQFAGFSYNKTGVNITLCLPSHKHLMAFRRLDAEKGLANHLIDFTYGFSSDVDDHREAEALIIGWGEDRKKGVFVRLRIDRDLLPIFEGLTHKTQTTKGDSVFISIVPVDTEQQEAQQEAAQKKKIKGEYGALAQSLRQSSFFRNPQVWQSIGSDNDYNQWVKRQKSAYSGRFSEYHDNGDRFCVPAHYRKVSEGSGTGIKPDYSTIPLTNDEHQKQHQHGYGVIGDEHWWQVQRINHVQRWCWETLRAQLGYESWSQVPPRVMYRWAESKGLDKYLPYQYRQYRTERREAHFQT